MPFQERKPSAKKKGDNPDEEVKKIIVSVRKAPNTMEHLDKVSQKAVRVQSRINQKY